MTDQTFETRLLARLHELADAPASVPAPRRRYRRSAVLGAAAAGLVLAAGSAAAVGILPGDPDKEAVEQGAPHGPEVAAEGGWTVYAAPRAGGGYDLQVVSAGFSTGSVVADAGPAIEAEAIEGSAGDAVFGRVRTAGAARVRVTLPDGTSRATSVGTHGFFVIGLDSGERPGSARVAALGAGGKRLAEGRVVTER
jgi:hypothetical protein